MARQDRELTTGGSVPVALPAREPGGWRAQVRARPGGRLLLRVATLVVGLAFIALGGVLVVLPGPWTIPPILVGLFILSTEFEWADRLLVRAKKSAADAWDQARAKPVTSSIVTVGGLLLAGVAIWAVRHYDLVDRATGALGL